MRWFARVCAVVSIGVIAAGCELPRPDTDIHGNGEWDGQVPVSSVEIPEICLPEFDPDTFEYTDSCTPPQPHLYGSG